MPLREESRRTLLAFGRDLAVDLCVPEQCKFKTDNLIMNRFLNLAVFSVSQSVSRLSTLTLQFEGSFEGVCREPHLARRQS